MLVTLFMEKHFFAEQIILAEGREVLNSPLSSLHH